MIEGRKQEMKRIVLLAIDKTKLVLLDICKELWTMKTSSAARPRTSWHTFGPPLRFRLSD